MENSGSVWSFREVGMRGFWEGFVSRVWIVGGRKSRSGGF